MNSSNSKNEVLKHNLSKNYRIIESLRLKLHDLKSRPLFKQKVNEEQLSLIAGNLAQIYKDGIPITIALELVSDSLSSKAYKNSLVKVLTCIKQGKSLSDGFKAFEDLYPKFFIGILSIGENTGKLYEVLKGLNIFYDKLLFIKREIKNASAYPIFIFVSMIILSIFLMNKVIPSFCEIYQSMNIELPANCRLLNDMNNSIKNKPFLSGITIISWISILLLILRHFTDKISIEKFTKINIVKSFFEYVMVLLFSIITSTGINISQALEYCEESISFIYLKKKIKEINKSIQRGNTLTESLAKSGVFSKYTLAIVKIREESGTIEEGFKELSLNLEYKLSRQIKKYLKWISPIFIFIMATFIVIFLLAFVLPLFQNLKSGIR